MGSCGLDTSGLG